MHTWNRERKRTRDRLLQYNLLPIINPSAINPFLPIPTSIDENILEDAIFNIAAKYGFMGTKNDFWTKFNTQNVHSGTLQTFPVPGIEYDLYLDTETSILYYFRSVTQTVYSDLAARIGIAIVGTHIIQDTTTTITYLYIPVQALPIENLIYDCGDAFS